MVNLYPPLLLPFIITKSLNGRCFSSSSLLLNSATLKQNKKSSEDYLADPNKLIIIPIRKERSYIYYKHSEELLNKDSKILKFENYTLTKGATLWRKIKDSPNIINRRIVDFVDFFLNQISWTETSLRSIPGERYILKGLRKMDKKTGMHNTTAEYVKDITSNDKKSPMLPISVYYPNDQLTSKEVVRQAERLANEGLRYHFKYMWYCIIGIPLTFPLILIPIIPNVPGFYLTYRAYCNLKAYLGAKHLKAIIHDHNHVQSSARLEFQCFPAYSRLFKRGNTDNMRLDTDLKDKIINFLDIKEIDQDLTNVIKQESRIREKVTHK
ncbi:Mrx19p NDAI_0A02980 [Naumovozyma dairenensis CBS 421]|uniref:Uncharacterized protein n=1 Tax=Naumovozyma dairenensis (strain ATCC 10597 / BCRC 20456 / CBS 421 / NBRC 0211 / NRRL Y-12639) TaxID=1071378 RepID=G0W3R7_NAUDC|nr:hypothetical protein NDAI_0A02980 [Naumovozyma dairenensis CBS 421]CCD22455.1 hypothetical protein NDAI_0A02980 [Naumovozyma dairenensis CBS 421]